MSALYFTFPFPPSVNAMYRFHGKKMYMVCDARKYKWAVQYQLNLIKPPKFDDSDKISLLMHLRPSLKQKRAYDADNRFKAICDAMQDYGLFKDDKQLWDIRAVKFEPEGEEDSFVEVWLGKL